MVLLIILVFLRFCIIEGYPERDRVLFKLDPGARYQYVYDHNDNPYLVDLWLKTSDVEASASFNPEIENNYYLFTRANPKVGQLIPIGNIKMLNESNFDPVKKTALLVHGWLNTPDSPFNVDLTHAYLTAEDVNLIMTDWSRGASGSYLVAILNCIKSGVHTATFISWVNEASGASLSRYHFIGHSLGAHQVGIIGRELNEQVPYITALDPALPGWLWNPRKLTSDAGKYTEVIHTGGGVLGILHPLGDVDFYPNCGWNMPGCGVEKSCNHHRSVLYMGESLMTGGFTGIHCDSFWGAIASVCFGPNTLKMGGPTPKTGTTGIYYLATNAEPPFSQG